MWLQIEDQGFLELAIMTLYAESRTIYNTGQYSMKPYTWFQLMTYYYCLKVFTSFDFTNFN